MKDLKKEARDDGSGGETLEKWLVDMESIKQHYGLTHTVTKHLKEGKNMSLSEFENLCLYVFSFYDSEWERQIVWMNVGTTLFFHTKECKDLNFEPFSRPLNQLMEEKVTAEVSKGCPSLLLLACPGEGQERRHLLSFCGLKFVNFPPLLNIFPYFCMIL